MPLTDVLIRQAIPSFKPVKLSDSGGLYLLLRPNGSKHWYLKIRIYGKEQKLAFGRYPDVSLKEARAARDEARLEHMRGGDPVQRRRDAKAARTLSAANRFEDVAEEYIQKCQDEDYAEATTKKARWFLDLLRPALGKRPIAEIKPHELLAALKKIERTGARESAKRARSFASRVFRYAIATVRAENDPAMMLRGALLAPTVRHQAAITDPAALGDFLRAIDGYLGTPATLYALRIAPHVFVRPSELRRAEWKEFDLNKAVWNIPAGKKKERRPHRVPLSSQVIAMLEELALITGRDGYVFSSLVTKHRPMSENTINAAFRRLGFTSAEICGHGLRTTASTLLNESGKWNHDAIERALAHKDLNAVRGIYDRGERWNERVAMAQWWSDYLDERKVYCND